MRLTLLFIILLFQLPLVAQEEKDSTDFLKVEYKFFRKLTERSLPINEIHSLKNYNSVLSIYQKETESEYLKNQANADSYDVTANFGVDGSEKIITLKDFINDTIMSIYPVIRKYKKVGEKIPEIDWKLETETKEILGYNCKKATTNYRGRNYIAYYTTEIPFYDGPFKFSGLPGLILSVSEENNKVSFEAVYIERSKTLNVIENPINKEKLISWKEYKTEYQKAFDRFGKFVNSKISENNDAEINVSFPSKNNYPPTIEVLEFND
ncbi:GLPGLI family protein [Mesonia sp. HuA40]|uniref:GLPGLI family protein n=1 Tax=Mesonia sp. HuA40 TaxID=2602761 RepID=UPI0011CA16FA|nr:GLPGLI family protein [Mesonia sp. HuA40]TXK72484.1 GLPGLI family protein [Mesonia sp. HuA40]